MPGGRHMGGRPRLGLDSSLGKLIPSWSGGGPVPWSGGHRGRMEGWRGVGGRRRRTGDGEGRRTGGLAGEGVREISLRHAEPSGSLVNNKTSGTGAAGLRGGRRGGGGAAGRTWSQGRIKTQDFFEPAEGVCQPRGSTSWSPPHPPALERGVQVIATNSASEATCTGSIQPTWLRLKQQPFASCTG